MARLLPILLLCAAAAFASIAAGGYSGYFYTPTPSSLDKGEVGYSARYHVIGENDLFHSVAMRPIELLELGLGISRKPMPAAKIILPFFDSLPPSAAFGFFGKRAYFTGMLQSISESKNALNLTIAGVYNIDQHFSTGSLALEIDLGYASLSTENFFYKNRYGTAGTFTLKPLSVFNMPSYFEASTGAAWRSPEREEDFTAFAAVQIKAPLIQSDKNPLVYIDINPAFDHSFSFPEDDYPFRLAFDMDAVIVAPFNFYMVGGLSPSLKTKNQDRLPRRDIIDRYYLFWEPDKIVAWVAAGMLNSEIYGVQGKLAKALYNPNPFALTLGYTVGDQKGLNAVGQIPLHPQFSGFLSNSLLFAEGGLFLGEKLAAQLNLRQGSEKKHLQIGSGYDFERKSIFGELSFQYDFSLSKQISGMEIRLAPNLRHIENSDFYIFDYDPIYQEGNNGRRLHNFPWRR